MSFDFTIFLSLAFLFGIAAHFRAMDGYSSLRSLITFLEGRLSIVYAVVLVTGVFSPFVLNDVVILILTPALIKYAKQFKVDIAPLLVSEISFTNIASSVTPFGNPQNILLWQATGISAGSFVLGTWFPLLVSGAITAAALYPFSRRERESRGFPGPIRPRTPLVYLIMVAVTVFSLDTLGASSLTSLGIGFAIGVPFTFRSPRRLLKEFDIRSLLILFVLVGSVALVATLVQQFLVQYVGAAAAGNQPYSAIFVGLTSNLISNVPAIQLILRTVPVAAVAVPRLAVEAGLAGNITPIGSFANILALLIVKRSGLPIKRAILLQAAIGLISFLPAFLG